MYIEAVVRLMWTDKMNQNVHNVNNVVHMYEPKRGGLSVLG